MFTGIIEALGRIEQVSARAGGALRLAVAAISGTDTWFPEGKRRLSSKPWDDVKPSESLCVDGICLTVSEVREGGVFEFDVVAESVRRTTAGQWRPGKPVNLERALRVGDRLGGHIVSGHVDGLARLEALADTGTGREALFALDAPLMRYVAEKGAIALNGVSLTVAGIEAAGLRVALIPETLARTNLGSIRPGDSVNVEVDLLARYVERLLAAEKPAGLSFESLGRAGFV